MELWMLNLQKSTELDEGLGLEGNLDAETIVDISYPPLITVYNAEGVPPLKANVFTPENSTKPFLD